MAIQSGEKRISNHVKEHSDPPGKIKIAGALQTLLKEKDFNSITSAEIAKTSGVNQALIYRYYKDPSQSQTNKDTMYFFHTREAIRSQQEN